MEYRLLGKTGLKVSRLCFGTLTMGPLQANLSLEEGASLLVEAFSAGINFWDTAESYHNYPYLRLALKKIGSMPIIASRTYASNAAEAEASLEKARVELDLEVIPIFMLHEQESALTLEGHRPALEYLCAARERGLIQAVGISCHTVAAVKAAILFPELDLIHPLINYRGIGIKDGSAAEMLAAIETAYKYGLGIYGMKVLGGGHLNASAKEAISFALELECLHALAIGMASLDELTANLCYMQGKDPSEDTVARLSQTKRRLKIEDWCTGCGYCVEACPQGALVVEHSLGRVVLRENCCILCGYCGAACPEMCLKIF